MKLQLKTNFEDLSVLLEKAQTQLRELQKTLDEINNFEARLEN